MQYMVVGIFAKYGDAESAVADLEHFGIVGQQVELITDVDEDIRTQNTPGEPSTVPIEQKKGVIARLFGPGGPFEKPDVRDESGVMPDYIGEQVFYANHVKEGGAVIIVRTSTEELANRASSVLKDNGGRNPGQKSGPIIRQINTSASAGSNG
jgi:hypothetical protein